MHLPAATIRTQVMLPLRFADGFGTTARVYTFDGLADGRVLHRRRPRERAVRLRAAAARGGPAHRAGRSHRRGAGVDRGAATKAGRGAHTLDLPCDDVLDAEA